MRDEAASGTAGDVRGWLRASASALRYRRERALHRPLPAEEISLRLSGDGREPGESGIAALLEDAQRVAHCVQDLHQQAQLARAWHMHEGNLAHIRIDGPLVLGTAREEKGIAGGQFVGLDAVAHHNRSLQQVY